MQFSGPQAHLDGVDSTGSSQVVLRPDACLSWCHAARPKRCERQNGSNRAGNTHTQQWWELQMRMPANIL